MMQFKGFKPEAMQRIAGALGYQGDMSGFNDYLNQNPDKKQQMDMYQQKAVQMLQGGLVKMQQGGMVFTGGQEGFFDLNKDKFDADGFIGDPRRMRQDLTFDKATGAYKSFGSGFFNQPVSRNTNIDQGYYDSQEYKDFISSGPKVGTMDVRYSPYFGRQGSGSIGGAEDAAYEAYLKRTNKLDYLKGGSKFTAAEGYQDPRNNVLSENIGTIDFDPKADPRGVPVQDGPDLRDATQYLTNLPETSYSRPTPSSSGGLGLGVDIGGQLESLYLPDMKNPKSEDQIKKEYAAAQEKARKRRAAGFMGMVVLPGEMSYEHFAEENRYNVIKNPNVPEHMFPEAVPLPEDTGTLEPSGINYTYDQAVARQAQMDVKTPEEARAISAALERGPGPSDVSGPATDPRQSVQTPPQQPTYEGESITELQARRALDPSLPYGATVQPVGTEITPQQIVDPRSGQVEGDIQVGTTQAGTAQAGMPTPTAAATYEASMTSNDVANVVAQTTAQQGQVDPNAIVDAQQATTTSVSDLEAAQGKAVLMDNPVQRKVEQGELVSSTANAATAAKFTEEVQAAQATPTKQATVQGQLETLMQQFEGGKTPAWAAGAMRNATATMAARGLGASSMAGQSLIQAAMESAVPIAQADAKTIASFEAQNLSNRQQRAMLAAEQRAAFIGQEFDQAFQARVINASKISDIANMNFTAEQQIALENSRAANTMNLANLGNRQALVMSEAAALANMDMANLNNRQQAAVMNAQSFLQMDMANLSNRQQTTMFNAQQRIQSLFTDQAASNAARAFNATSENQTNQFFANLATQTSQFNAAQTNAMSQFNAGEANVMERFAAEMMNQRDQFNAQNRLVIDQNNAQWRRQVATADTAAINRANEINATNLLNMSNTAYNDLWSYYQDSMEYAWNSAENERERIMNLAIAKLQIDSAADIAADRRDYESASAWGGLIATMFTTPLGGDTLLGKGLNFLGIG